MCIRDRRESFVLYQSSLGWFLPPCSHDVVDICFFDINKCLKGWYDRGAALRHFAVTLIGTFEEYGCAVHLYIYRVFDYLLLIMLESYLYFLTYIISTYLVQLSSLVDRLQSLFFILSVLQEIQERQPDLVSLTFCMYGYSKTHIQLGVITFICGDFIFLFYE